ncbi:MAG TPA: hypothetical protein VII46_07835, partial [Acidimicrobiales bacterium]
GAEVLASLAPEGPVYQAGTLSGNPVATAAGLAVLAALDDHGYAGLSARVARFGSALAEGLSAVLSKAGTVDDQGRPIEAQVPVVGPLFGLFFVPVASRPVGDYEGAVASASTGLYARLFRAMLDRGVAFAPGPYEVGFPSMAHGELELELALDVASAAMADVLSS